MLKWTETHGEGGRMIVEDLFEFYFLLVNVLDNGTYQNQRKGGGGGGGNHLLEFSNGWCCN